MARKCLNLDTNTKLLLFFGQIKEAKGLDVLLDAFPKILLQHPNTTLLIAGRPWKENFAKYTKKINQLKIEKNCILHLKFISDDDIPYYFCSPDIIVLPYKKIYQSAVLLMAMSYGKPILSSDLTATKEIINDKKTGFLFSSEDPSSLAKQAIYILNNPNEAERVAENGQQLMIKSHDWHHIGELTLMCYKQGLH